MTAKELEREVERLKGVIAAGRELQAELVDALQAYVEADDVAQGYESGIGGEEYEKATALLRKHGRLW